MSVKRCAAKDSRGWHILLEKHTPWLGFRHSFWKIKIYESDVMNQGIVDVSNARSEVFYVVGLINPKDHSFTEPKDMRMPPIFLDKIVCFDKRKKSPDQVFDVKNRRILTRNLQIKDVMGFKE